MHDHSLGPEVDVGVNPDALHRGPCTDGVYGCSRCWDAANDGKGTVSECDWCHTPDVFTIITRASDEPVSYAVCGPCRKRAAAALAAELREEDARYGHLYERFDDDYPEDGPR